jgi:hypothetical protein
VPEASPLILRAGELARVGALGCGILAAAYTISLVVWTARDISQRTDDELIRILAVLLIIALNVFGLVIYLLLRPQTTKLERHERALLEEALLREASAPTWPRRGGPLGPAQD